MPFGFGDFANSVRERQCLREVLEPEGALEALDSIALDDGPVGYLGQQVGDLGIRSVGVPARQATQRISARFSISGLLQGADS